MLVLLDTHAVHDSQCETLFEVPLIRPTTHDEIPELDPVHRLRALNPLDVVAVDNEEIKHF